MLNEAVRYLFDKLGYQVIPKWRDKNREHASLLRAILTRQAVDCVVDVGANDGQFGRFMRLEVGFTGTILSFEPQRELAGGLARISQADACWQVFPFALGSADAELTLNVMQANAFSSFLSPDNRATPQFEDGNRVLTRYLVPVRRLDAVAEIQPFGKIFLKSDTQGFDLEVFRGARALLSRVVGLQLELSLTQIYRDMPHYLDVLRELRAQGFQPAGFFPVSRNPDLSAIEFDCVLVNTSESAHRQGHGCSALMDQILETEQPERPRQEPSAAAC